VKIERIENGDWMNLIVCGRVKNSNMYIKMLIRTDRKTEPLPSEKDMITFSCESRFGYSATSMLNESADDRVFFFEPAWRKKTDRGIYIYTKARRLLLEVIKIKFGYIPKGLIPILKEYLHSVAENRRRMRIDRISRIFLRIASPEEIIESIRHNVVKQVIES
jgi:hypothetical protein